MVSLNFRLRILALGILYSFGLWIILSLIFLIMPFKEISTLLDRRIYDIMLSHSISGIRPFDKLIVIDINDPNENISRDKYARLIDKLGPSGAKIIGVDMVFWGNKDSIADDHLVQSVRQHAKKLVLAFMFVDSIVTSDPRDAETYLQPYNILDSLIPVPKTREDFETELREFIWTHFYEQKDKEKGVLLPFSPLLKLHSEFGLGHITYFFDFDGRIRYFPMVLKYGKGYYPSFALEIVKRYFGANFVMLQDNEQFALQKEDTLLVLPLDRDGQVLMNLIDLKNLYISRKDLNEKPNSFEAMLENSLGKDYQDAIVLIVNSRGEGELTDRTYFSEEVQYPKWGFHASLISQIIEQAFIQDDPMGSYFWAEIIIILIMIWLLTIEYRFKPERRKLWMVLLTVNVFYIAFTYFLVNLDVRLYFVVPLLVINMTYILIRNRFYTIIKPPSFLNIEILVGKIQNGTYQVSITQSPFGVASGFCKDFLNESGFRDSINNIRNFYYHERDVSFVGCRLFQALFPIEVQRIYDRCGAQAEREENILRLKLRIDADELATLPWELLHDAQLRKGYIVLSKQISLSRHIQSIGEPNLLNLNLPLKILVMISSPKGLPQLDVASEKVAIKKAFRSLIWLRDVHITFTEKATPEELERFLDYGIQIFHYIGHSAFNPETNEARLALEDDHDNLNWVEGDRLAYLMQKSKVQIVILNSCQSATTSEVDAFSGISQKLINAGVPSVIAMQYPITDPTAILFAKKFYNTFVQHFSIDEAVNQARRSIMAHEGVEKIDWATPVLFSSVDGAWWDKFKL